MAESTQEVKARLVIEKDGEPDVFDQTASAIEELGSTASSAGDPVAQMASQLEQLAESAQGLGPVAQGAVREFASAIKEASSATDIDSQREAITRAADAWEKFGKEAVKAAELPEKSLRELEATVDALRTRAAELADPLTKSAGEASIALKQIGASASEGFKGAEDRLAKAKTKIDEYRRALVDAKAAGQNVTGSQVQELQRLEAEYDDCTRKIGAFRSAQAAARNEVDRTSREIRGQVGSIGSLQDVLETAVPKWTGFIRGAAGIVGAFTAGYQAGERLRSVLNAMTDGDFDRWISKVFGLQRAADALAGSSDKAADRIRLLANQKNVFENIGLEGFSDDVDKNARLLNDHRFKIVADSAALEEFSKKVGLSRAELDKQSNDLAKNITAFANANQQLSQSDLAKIFKEEIQGLLDSFVRLGIEAPPALKKVADAWGIVSSEAESGAAATEAAAARILAAITGVTVKTRAELVQEAKAIEAAFSNLKVGDLDTAGFERARAELQKVVDEFTAAGLQIPQSVTNIAAKFLVYQDAAGLTASSLGEVSRASESLAGSLVTLSSNSQGADRAVRDLGTGSVEVSRSLDATRISIESSSPSIDELMERYGAAGRASKEAASGAREHGEAAGAAGQQIANAAGALQQSASAAADAGGKIGSAAGQIDKAAQSTSGLSQAARTVSLRPLVEELTSVDRLVVQASRSIVTDFTGAFTTLGAGVRGFSAPILIELDKIIAKAIQAKAALEGVEA